MAAKKRKKKAKYPQTPWEKANNKAPLGLLVERYHALGNKIRARGSAEAKRSRKR